MKRLVIITILLFTIGFLASIFGQQPYQKPELIIQTGHSGAVISLAFSPDGALFATGDDDRSIKLWSTATGQELRTLNGHSNSVVYLSFSPDGKTLASATLMFSVKLWNVQTGKEIRLASFGKDNWIGPSPFSPNGSKFISSGPSNSIRLWNTKTGRPAGSLIGHTKKIFCASFSSDGHTIVTASEDGSIKIWDVPTVQIKTSIDVVDPVTSLVLSHDGQSLITGDTKGNVKLRSIESGQELRTLVRHAESISSVSISSGGDTIASESNAYAERKKGNTTTSWTTGSVKLFNMRTHRETRSFDSGSRSSYRGGTFWPNAETFAVLSSKTDDLTLWRTDSGKKARVYDIDATQRKTFGFSPNGKTVVQWDSKKSEMSLLGVQTGVRIRLSDRRIASIMAVGFSPDGKRLAVGATTYKINLWDMETGHGNGNIPGPEGGLVRLTTTSDSAGFHSLGALGYTFSLWDPKAYNPNAEPVCGECWTGQGAYSSDRKFLTEVNGTRIEIREGEEWKSFSDDKDAPDLLVAGFSPDNKRLVTGNAGGVISTWDIESGKKIKSIRAHSGQILSVSYSPDGRTIISSGLDRIIRLWHSDAGTLKSALQGSEFAVTSVALSPDEKVVVSGVGDATVQVWDVKSRRVLCSLISLSENNWVVTTSDGRFDTNKLEDPQGLHWIMPDAPFDPYSFEVFMRDYYEPNLLPRLLRCTEENSCDKEFKPVRNLADLNRTQPRVEITSVVGMNAIERKPVNRISNGSRRSER